MIEYHRHATGDVVQGEAARCIDPDAGAEDVVVMTPDELAARDAGPLEALAADLYRDHDMPPNKDSHGYDYRMGWWDGVHHAASVAQKASKTTRVLPPGGGRA